MSSRIVFWIGGMSGVGKTTAARAVARRHDLWLYSLDARTYAHAEATDARGLTMSADQLWLERSPEQMADDFETEARRRFPLVLEDVAAIADDGAPVVVEGPQLLPVLVAGRALFVVAKPELQRRLVEGRGSLTFARTRDPERALRNRLRRDELLAGRVRSAVAVAEIGDVGETEPLVEAFVREHAHEWVTAADHGDVASRRRDENERRVDQWRRYAEHEPRARDGTIDLACECDRPGCAALVPVELSDAGRRPRLAH